MELVRAAVGCGLAVAALVVGCSSADPYGAPLPSPRPVATQSGLPPASAAVCASAAPAAGIGDPSTLPACCTAGQTGRARCVAREKVPAGVASQLDTCATGLCVPETFVKDPNYQPKKCKAFNGFDGACMSVCVKQVAEVVGILTQDVCEADERCAPCVDPRSNQPSGACDVGHSKEQAAAAAAACDKGQQFGQPAPTPGTTQPAAPQQCPHQGPPVLDPNTLPPCGTSGGAHCVPANLVPPSQQGQLAACGGGFCVPDLFIATGGNFIPRTCGSVGGVEGRCLHVDLPEVAAQASKLPVSTCQPFERCAPCFDPLTGQATAACRQSCDRGPVDVPRVFKGCCQKGGFSYGRCIPNQMIPPGQDKEYLSEDECFGENKGVYCVPAEMVVDSAFAGKPCQASALLGTYSGVCLSDCLDFGLEGIAMDRGSCDNVHTCVPCKNPLTGASTGAPGCPP